MKKKYVYPFIIGNFGKLHFVPFLSKVSIISFILLFLSSCTSSLNYTQYTKEDSLSFEEMQKCTEDSDCIYADNSCCPYTDSDNIVAINKIYKEDYGKLGEICVEDINCPENTVERTGTKCSNNKCLILPLSELLIEK